MPATNSPELNRSIALIKGNLTDILTLYEDNSIFKTKAKNLKNTFKQAEETAGNLSKHLSLLVAQLTALRTNIKKKSKNIEEQESLLKMISSTIKKADELGITLKLFLSNIIDFLEKAFNKINIILRNEIKMKNMTNELLKLRKILEEEIDYLRTLYKQLDTIRHYSSMMWQNNTNYEKNIADECQKEKIFNSLILVTRLLDSNLINERTKASIKLQQVQPTISKIVSVLQ